MPFLHPRSATNASTRESIKPDMPAVDQTASATNENTSTKATSMGMARRDVFFNSDTNIALEQSRRIIANKPTPDRLARLIGTTPKERFANMTAFLSAPLEDIQAIIADSSVTLNHVRNPSVAKASIPKAPAPNTPAPTTSAPITPTPSTAPAKKTRKVRNRRIAHDDSDYEEEETPTTKKARMTSDSNDDGDSSGEYSPPPSAMKGKLTKRAPRLCFDRRCTETREDVEWIQCDGDLCEKSGQWFHITCLGWEQMPTNMRKKEWYCPMCRVAWGVGLDTDGVVEKSKKQLVAEGEDDEDFA